MGEKSNKQALKEQQAAVANEFIYQGKIISVYRETLKFDDDKTIYADIISHPGAVAIIPINSKGEILLIKQWRRAAKQIIIEIPAGTLEPNEPISLCAQRELQEEIGYKAKEMISLGGFFSSPGFCTEYIHLFLANELIESPLHAEDTDSIDLLAVTLSEALAMIDENIICDAKTISAILLYKRWIANHTR